MREALVVVGVVLVSLPLMVLSAFAYSAYLDWMLNTPFVERITRPR